MFKNTLALALVAISVDAIRLEANSNSLAQTDADLSAYSMIGLRNDGLSVKEEAAEEAKVNAAEAEKDVETLEIDHKIDVKDYNRLTHEWNKLHKQW